jgi:hypothetical protein
MSTIPREQIISVLAEARRLIDNGWTQGHWAENMWGKAVAVNDYSACKFCAQGAMIRAADKFGVSRHMQCIYDAVSDQVPSGYAGNFMSFNDTNGRTKEQVKELLDRAIQSL